MDGMTPVSVLVNPEGVTIISIKGSTTYKRLIPWKEMYKLGLRGEKVTGPAFTKQLAKKVDELVASNVKNMDSNKEFLKRMRRTKVLLPPRPAAAP
jgi:hypothetical protein